MITLVSSNYLPPHHRYEFNPENGEFRKKSSHDDFREAAVGARGYLQERRAGVLRKRQVFAAIYALDNTLHVWINQDRFSWPGPFRVCRRARPLGVKHFSISTTSEPRKILTSFLYVFIDSLHAPTEIEIDDIFSKIASKTKNLKRVSRFIDYWEANSKTVNYEDVARPQRRERREGDFIIALRSKDPYPPHYRYEFNPKTGEYRKAPSPDDPEEDFVGIRGWCDERQIGVLKKRQIFAAIYSQDGLLHVWVDGSHFTWPGSFQVRRRSLLSRVKRFSISTTVKPCIVKTSFLYVFIDELHSFPDPEEVDIFYTIAWKTKTPKEVRAFIDFWEARAAGRDLWPGLQAMLVANKNEPIPASTQEKSAQEKER